MSQGAIRLAPTSIKPPRLKLNTKTTSLFLLYASILGGAFGAHQHLHNQQNILDQDGSYKMANPNSVNVFNNPLKFFSNNPLTGYMRNGYCEVPPSDYGNHSVAAELTEEFLDYTMAQGNDLRQIGLRGGCKWCICASRWQEAYAAMKDGKISEKAVPKVWLEATNRRALEKLDMNDLKAFSKDSGSGGQ